MAFFIKYEIPPSKEICGCGFVAKNESEARRMFARKFPNGILIKIEELS